MKRIGILLAAGVVLLALANWFKVGRDNPAAEARAAYHRGDYGRALEKYRQAAKDSPDPARAAHNQAATLARLRRYKEATQYYRCEQEAGGGRRAAQAAYDRANCEVHLARQKTPAGKDRLDPALLAQAVEHYRNCLDHDTGRGALFANARHNLDLARALLAEAGGPPAKPEEAAKQQPDASSTTLARNDGKKDTAKDGLQGAKKEAPEDLCPT